MGKHFNKIQGIVIYTVYIHTTFYDDDKHMCMHILYVYALVEV